MNIRAKLHGMAGRFPIVAKVMRPVMRPIIHVATRDNVAWTKVKFMGAVNFCNDKMVQRFKKSPVTRNYVEAMRRTMAAPANMRLEFAAERQLGPGIGNKAFGNVVLMLVVSDLRIDPRVEREARALAAGGYDVHILCPDPTHGTEENFAMEWGRNVNIIFTAGNAATYVGEKPGFMGGMMYDAALELATRLKPFAIHAHDLNTAYVGLAVARLTGAHLVADFHEWTSENVHWDYPEAKWKPYVGAWKAELQALEARLMREASAVVTVCESIIDALAEELGNGRRATLIRNIPSLVAVPTKDYPPLKQQLGLAEDKFVLLWQGGTGTTRLIEPIIEALKFAPKCTFVIRGPSLDLFGKDYMAIAERIGAGDRLILQGPVPSRDVVAAARGADAGIWTLPAFCRNFTYALPNKIFEYIASNLPTLVADYPEAKRMVETHQVGLTFDPYDPKSIAKAINRLIDDPAFAKTCRDNTTKALATLDADGEWRKLVTLYDSLPRSPEPEQKA